LVDVNVKYVAVQLIPFQPIAEAAEEEKEEALQVCSKADDLQKFKIVPPSLYALDRPFNPRLQWLLECHDVRVNGYRTQEINSIFGPGRAEVLNEYQMRDDGYYLNDEWSEDVTLGEEKRLGGIIKCEGVD
jgi:hypothetical protein